MSKKIIKLAAAVMISGFINTSNARANTGINLQVITSTTTIYSQNISVAPCPLSPTSSTTMVTSSYCALEQAGLSNNWSWFGDDAFLNSLNGVINNDGGNGVYWNWFGNLAYGQTSLSAHNLTEGEKLLLAYNINPLKISADTLSPASGATSTILAEKFGFDSGFNPVWSPATTSAVYLNGEQFPADNTGHYAFLASSTAPYTASAAESNYIPSNTITISPAPAPQPQPASGGSAWVPTAQKVDVQKAIQYLISRQKSDGSYGGVYSDWVAVAFGAYGINNEALKNFLLADNKSGLSLTDYERRAMALETLGVSPYDGAPVNYIKKITDQFDGVQFGDKNLYNDDVFAVFPLVAAGYSSSNPMILNSAKFIISKQSADGSWNGVDMTSAAVQALTLAPGAEGTQEAIKKAKDYLHQAQQTNGGFGNSFSTSWAIQAYDALGDLPQYWLKDKYPQDYLASLQQTDGGLENISADTSTRIWATAIAIPAALDKTWNNILQKFSPPSTSNLATSGSSSSEIPITATSTPAGAATTVLSLGIASSTLETAIPTPAVTETTESKPLEIVAAKIPEAAEKEIFPAEKTKEEKNIASSTATQKKTAAISLSGQSENKTPASGLAKKATFLVSRFARKIYTNLRLIFSWF